MKGYVHVYTGNGKGKTTAAIGQALRASGAGLKVFIGQFIKGKPYNENSVISKCLENVRIMQFGRGCFIINEPEDEDFKAAREGLVTIKSIVHSGDYDMVILDEVHIALYYHLINVDEIINMIKTKPEHVELILTGRYAPVEIIQAADLVTEMKEVKHYYQHGVQAKEGIEY